MKLQQDGQFSLSSRGEDSCIIIGRYVSERRQEGKARISVNQDGYWHCQDCAWVGKRKGDNKNRSTAAEHYRRKHQEVDCYECIHCDKKGCSATEIRQHHRRKHMEKSHHCTECSKCYHTERDLISHIGCKHRNISKESYRTLTCDKCGSKHKSRGGLTYHYGICSE